MSFEPRDWQKYAADQCVAIALAGADRALIYACPGSGKTFGGLYIASELKRRAGLGPKLVVFTPNLAIKTQWIERAEAVGFKLRPVLDIRELLDDELELEECGFVLTYQQAIGCKNVLRQFCERHKPIVILDEVHHTEGPRADREGNQWGISIETACKAASFKLCTTGTPFRQGNLPITFVRYNDNGEAIALVRYTYAQAIIDGHCRALEFNFYDGEIEWHDGQHIIAADFTTPLTKRRKRQRLRAAISTEGEFTTNMLKEAHKCLIELRRNEGVDARAAGLVVAENSKHANEIAIELEKISGIKPVVVHYKIDEAIAEINRFRDGDAMWIIGVAMISEGVDIPRLRVGVYATNITAPLYFHQFCGRFCRVMKSRQERSFIWMPDDPELTAVAMEINKEKFHALGELEPVKPVRGGEGGRKRREINVEDSNSELVGKAIPGFRVDADFVKQHRAAISDLRLKNSQCLHWTDLECLKLLVSCGVIKGPSEAAE
jgi:superfamily II DNA or RNA helicase